MNCKFCGKELVEGAVFCSECGKSVTEETEKNLDVTPGEENKQLAQVVENVKKKINFNTICLIVGTFLIVVGFIRLIDSSVSISSTSFGADFYTYTYKGIVACAEMLSKINKSLSWCIIAIGAIIDIKAVKWSRKNK